MKWGRIDDKLHSHPKLMRIPRERRCEAVGLWTLANSWSKNHGTDGHVPREAVGHFASTGDVAGLLVDAGMWREHGEGYVFENWSGNHFSADEVSADTPRCHKLLKPGGYCPDCGSINPESEA